MSELSSLEDSAIPTQDPTVSILLVEDSPTDAQNVQMHLSAGLSVPFEIEHVETLADAIRLLGQRSFDLVLLDLTLSDSSSLDTFHTAFEHASEHASDDAILIVSGHEQSERAVEAVRKGAQKFICKGHLSPAALAREVRLAVERNRRMKAERERDAVREQIRIARRMQRGLYPQIAPLIDNFDMAGRAWAAEHACGDYFDFLPMQRNTLGLIVGDVSGHGLGPALKMVETRATLHALTEYESDLGRLISVIHRVFHHGQKFDGHSMLFLSLFLGRLDPGSRTLSYASAGHPGFHMTADGHVTRLEPTDFPIGLVEDMSSVTVQRVKLASGDLIIIPTDGFYESRSEQRELLGMPRLLEIVRDHRDQSASAILEEMYSACRSHASGNRQEDDMAAIVLKVHG